MKSEKNTYKFLPKAVKHQLDMATVEHLEGTLDDGLYEAYAKHIGLLATIKEEGHKLSEDQEQCLRHPLRMWKTLRKLLGDE